MSSSDWAGHGSVDVCDSCVTGLTAPGELAVFALCRLPMIGELQISPALSSSANRIGKNYIRNF